MRQQKTGLGITLDFYLKTIDTNLWVSVNWFCWHPPRPNTPDKDV